MLLVKTFIKDSLIPGAGLGCFAGEFIERGRKIWELHPNMDRIISKIEFEKLPDIEKEFVVTYGYMYNGDFHLCIDNARFFNHSIENCNTIDPSSEMATYAKRDINIGEEILSNYLNFGLNSSDVDWMLKIEKNWI